MVLRVWMEDDAEGLRARLTATKDLAAADETVRVASTVTEIVEIVRDWVEEFAAAG
jgi:hypothetical protein